MCLLSNISKDVTLLKISLASLPCLSMFTLLKHAYSTSLKSSKRLKMSATRKVALLIPYKNKDDTEQANL